MTKLYNARPSGETYAKRKIWSEFEYLWTMAIKIRFTTDAKIGWVENNNFSRLEEL